MYVLHLDKIERGDRTVGEKALKLSGMLREALPVPEGFAVNTEGLRFFLKKNNMEGRISKALEGLDVEDSGKLREVSDEILGMFRNSTMPENLKKEIIDSYDNLLIRKEAKNIGGAALDFIRAGRDHIFVSVRASPVTSPDSSFPGLFETFLGVTGQKNLLEAVKLCWASLYTERAIFYRKKKEFPDLALGGVMVQKMIDSEKSGVILADREKVIVEGSFGLGSSVSYGMVMPDRYFLDGYSGELLDKKIGKKIWVHRKDAVSGRVTKDLVSRDRVNEQALDERELKKLFELYKRVSEHAGNQMMEFAVERGRVYLMQVIDLPEREESGGNGESEGREFSEGYSLSPGFVKGSVRVINNTQDFKRVEAGDLVVTKILSPELTVLLGKAKGVVSAYGGMGSSFSLMCREFGIPCVSDINTSNLSENQIVLLEGSRGICPLEVESFSHDLHDVKLEGPTATEVRVNLDFSRPFDIESADGVGLLRSETLFPGQNPIYLAKTNPGELANMLSGMKSVVQRAYPKVVWYRGYGVRSDVLGDVQERNPVLGFRGIRRSLEEPEMFRHEIETVRNLYSSGLKNIGIVLPFVSSVEEFRAAKNIIPFSLKLGIEICTPSSALDIESFCKEGLNMVLINLPELTQLTLGVDQANSRVSPLYSELNPSVMKLIGSVVRICRHYNVEVSVSLERYDPAVIERLVRIGVNSVSLEPEFVRVGKDLVSRIEKRMILDGLREKQEFAQY